MISIAPDDALRARFIATASEEARICDARGDRWITYPKAAVVLDQMERILAHPRNWRMPSLLILGEAGIGKTQIDRKFARLHPPEIGRERGRTTMPVVSIQMPPGVTQRILYLTLLETIGVHGPVAHQRQDARCCGLRTARHLCPRQRIGDLITKQQGLDNLNGNLSNGSYHGVGFRHSRVRHTTSVTINNSILSIVLDMIPQISDSGRMEPGK